MATRLLMKGETTMRVINENDSGPYHVLHLPRGNGWRQALVLSTYSHIIVDVGPLSSYTHMIWLELTSGQVCGLTIPFSDRFLSYNDLEIIAKCFESTPLQNYEALPLWVGKLFGWYECEYTNIEKDIVLIAENAKKFDRLSDEDMRIAIKPIITQFREGILAFNKGLDQNALSSAGITCIKGFAGIKAYNYKVNLVKALPLNHHQTKKLSEEPILDTMNSDHVLLPPGDGWRQVLVLPAVAKCADGVSLGSTVSRHMLWIELASGKVWGLTFMCYSRFLCMQDLKFISQCFESAQKDSYESIPGHICKHLSWSECKYAHVDTDIELIAGDLERENILSNKVPHKEYQLTDTTLQNAAKPIILALTNRIQAFNLGLDQEALLQVGKKYIGEISDVIAYNYQFHPIEKISIYRRQAMQTFPLLREKFSHFISDHRLVRLQQSIDSGNPLLPVLSDFFRCSKTVVRYLTGKDFSLIGNDWYGKN